MWWVQPAATLITAIVAITVATTVYRWQKVVDRETALLSEKRQKYDAYIKARNRVYATTLDSSPVSFSEAYPEYYVCRDQLVIQASGEVLDAVQNHATPFGKIWSINQQITQGEHSITEDEFRLIVGEEARLYQDLLSVFQADLQNHAKYPLKLPTFEVQFRMERPR